MINFNRMPGGRWAWMGLVVLLGLGQLDACAAGPEDDDSDKTWAEASYEWPALPQAADLLPFYVSATAVNRFFVDSRSLSVGSDGVVRYTLVIQSMSGVSNISFEGMHCDTKEWRIYGLGHGDRWEKAKNSRWESIKEAVVNRHRAVLFLDYFCPYGLAVRSADEARQALKQQP